MNARKIQISITNILGGGGILEKFCTIYDLSSYSQLIDVAGLNPTVTDLRCNAQLGAAREWGALEYDVDLEYGP